MMEFLTAKDIAALLRVSRAQAYRILKACAHVRIGRSLRVTREALDAYLENLENGEQR